MQNVGTPVFYVSYGDYFDSLGFQTSTYNLLNPCKHHTMTIDGGANWGWVDDEYRTVINFNGDLSNISKTPLEGLSRCNWMALLGHDMDSRFRMINKQAFYGADGTSLHHNHNGEDIYMHGINYGTSVANTGFSIQRREDALGNPLSMWADYSSHHETFCNSGSFTGNNGDHFRYMTSLFGPTIYQDGSQHPTAVTVNFGCAVYGRTYTMPQSPDLNLSLSYNYDEVTTRKTKNGGTISNSMANFNLWATDKGAWQLEGNENYRAGKRSWDLSFSYLSDSDIMPSNANMSFPLGETTNIITGDDFFSSVWNRTLGNGLPFIFQPDSTNHNPDQFAICKFSHDTLNYTQVAPNVYNINLQIEEVW